MSDWLTRQRDMVGVVKETFMIIDLTLMWFDFFLVDLAGNLGLRLCLALEHEVKWFCQAKNEEYKCDSLKNWTCFKCTSSDTCTHLFDVALRKTDDKYAFQAVLTITRSGRTIPPHVAHHLRFFCRLLLCRAFMPFDNHTNSLCTLAFYLPWLTSTPSPPRKQQLRTPKCDYCDISHRI